MKLALDIHTFLIYFLAPFLSGIILPLLSVLALVYLRDIKKILRQQTVNQNTFFGQVANGLVRIITNQEKPAVNVPKEIPTKKIAKKAAKKAARKK